MNKLTRIIAGVSAALVYVTGFTQGTGMLEEVVVTAQKREESLQDVPISITVFGEENLDRRQVDMIGELANIVPSFEFARPPSDSPGVTFRGIGTQAGNVAFDNSIGMFVDGAFLGNVRLYGHTLFDVQRVELIKGTQSTLLGKNTTLGGISVVNNRPEQEFGGEAEFGLEAQNGGWFGEGMVNLPVDDTLALRIAGKWSDLNGWIHNVTTGKDVPEDRDAGIRTSLLWEPSSRFNALISHQYTDNRRVGLPTQITRPGLSALGLGAGPDLGESRFDDTKASYSSDPRLVDGDDLTHLKVHLATGTLNYDFGAATLTSITSYATSDHTNYSDFDFDNKDNSLFIRTEDYEQIQQELRLASNGDGRLDYLAGVFFFDSEWDMLWDSVFGIPDFPPPPVPISGQIFNGSYTNTFAQETTAYSVFGQANYSLTEQFRVNLGLRFTHEKKKVHFGRTNRPPFTLWNAVIQAPFPYQRLDNVTDDLVSGSVSLQYDLTPDVMVYASFARGGKAGGYGEFNSIALDPALGTGNPQRDAFVDDERANSYEAGIKSSLLDGRVQLDVAVFHIDVFGLQQLLFTGEFISSNDRSRSTGVDGLLTWQVTDSFRVSAAGAYADAEDKGRNERLAQSPRVSVAFNADWEQRVFGDWSVAIGGTLKHRSSKFNQLSEGLYDNAFTSLALTGRLSSDSSPWFLNIVAENVTNTIGADFGFPGPDPFVETFETNTPLRSIKISVGTSF